MNGGTLNHALEGGRRFRFGRSVRRKPRQILVEKFGKIGAQLIEVDATGLEHRDRVGVFGQGEKQMFERRIFMPAFTCEGEGTMERLFEHTRQHGSAPFSVV